MDSAPDRVVCPHCFKLTAAREQTCTLCKQPLGSASNMTNLTPNVIPSSRRLPDSSSQSPFVWYAFGYTNKQAYWKLISGVMALLMLGLFVFIGRHPFGLARLPPQVPHAESNVQMHRQSNISSSGYQAPVETNLFIRYLNLLQSGRGVLLLGACVTALVLSYLILVGSRPKIIRWCRIMAPVAFFIFPGIAVGGHVGAMPFPGFLTIFASFAFPLLLIVHISSFVFTWVLLVTVSLPIYLVATALFPSKPGRAKQDLVGQTVSERNKPNVP